MHRLRSSFGLSKLVKPLFLVLLHALLTLHAAAGEPTPRYGHTLVGIGVTAYLFGGDSVGDGVLPEGVPVNDLWKFDGDVQEWELLTPANSPPPARSNHAACELNGKMYVHGGIGEGYQALGDIWVFDPVRKEWLNLPSLGETQPAPRQGHTLSAAGGKLVLFGGLTAGGSFIDEFAWLYDPATGSWQRKSMCIYGSRFGHCATSSADSVWIFGGTKWGGLSNDILRYIYGEDRWERKDSATDKPEPLTEVAGASEGSDIWVFGGRDQSGADRDGVFRYDVLADAWKQLSPLPKPRTKTAAALIKRDPAEVLIYGGKRDNKPVSETFVYRPRSCTIFCLPSASKDSGMAPLTVQFWSGLQEYNCSSRATLLWEFGDGQTSSEPDPEHVYSVAGTFTWSFTATSEAGKCTGSGTVVVSPHECFVTCEASAAPERGVAPLEVYFTSTSAAPTCSGTLIRRWNFGDGQSSNQQNVIHTFADPGVYNWSFAAEAEDKKCETAGRIEVLPAHCNLSCQASAEPSSGRVPLKVKFTSTFTTDGCDPFVEKRWTFGNGSGAGADIEYTYEEPGTYTWEFMATAGDEICTRSGQVTVSPSQCKLSCSPAASPSKGPAPLKVEFRANMAASDCTGQPVGGWAFGDGDSDNNNADTDHEYEEPGTYTWSFLGFIEKELGQQEGTVMVTERLPGDSDGDDRVSIGEVQQVITMFLGMKPPGNFSDCNGDGQVSIGEVQKVINAFLGLAVLC